METCKRDANTIAHILAWEVVMFDVELLDIGILAPCISPIVRAECE